MSGSRLAEHRREGWQILAAFQVTAKAAIAIEAGILRWWRGELGLPSFLRRDQMPQGGWTETVSAAGIDLAATVAHVCELALRPRSATCSLSIRGARSPRIPPSQTRCPQV
jgi:hypothetical protein